MRVKLLVLVGLAACGTPNGACSTCDSDAPTGDSDGATLDTDVAQDTDAAETDTPDTDVACDPGTPDDDVDGDGVTENQGDCDDCAAARSPLAFDAPGNGVDDDCSGTPDDNPTACDAGVLVDTTSATDAAHAIGLCRDATGGGWGLLEAAFIEPGGTALATTGPSTLGHGVNANFGAAFAPLEGDRVLSLSSGAARTVSEPGYQPPLDGFDKGYAVGFPVGYPIETMACPGTLAGASQDGVGLSVKIRTPSNAHSMQLDLAWFTSSFGQFACSQYGDFAVVTMAPAPAGAISGGNIAFDSLNDPLNANTSLLQACEAQTVGAVSYPCSLGTTPLVGTGFEPYTNHPNGAGTGWLGIHVPIESPGSVIELRFAVWDSGDGIQDSTLVVDHLRFSTDAAPLGSMTPH